MTVRRNKLLQSIENRVKFILERFPLIKKIIKRVYQLFFCTITNSWNLVEGDIIRVTPNDGNEYFCGYYGKSPFDATDRFLLFNKAKETYRDTAPSDPLELCVLDVEKNDIYVIGKVYAWNNQQGCMAQWIGPDYYSKIIYNDYRDGEYCSIVFNWILKQEEKVIPLPIYDLSNDGKTALTLDFSRLHRLRPGYGYSNCQEKTKGELCPDDYCIWKIDTENFKIEGVLKYTDLYNFEHDESMEGAEHKVNHIMINPSGSRFMVIHRWIKNGKKRSRLLTASMDGSDLFNLSDENYVSHCFWKNDNEILSFLRKSKYGDHYYLLRDKSDKYSMLWPVLKTDGHCSYSHNRTFVVTDSYPDRQRISTLYVLKEKEEPISVARVFSPFRYDNEFRCDLHPRWNFKDDKICFDSACEGRRAVYILKV